MQGFGFVKRFCFLITGIDGVIPDRTILGYGLIDRGLNKRRLLYL